MTAKILFSAENWPAWEAPLRAALDDIGVPCDLVTKESGAMGYIRGSHRGPTYAPKNLVTNQCMDHSMRRTHKFRGQMQRVGSYEGARGRGAPQS